MRAKKTKYTLRADGRIVLTKTIDGKRVCFYGQTDREVEQNPATQPTDSAQGLAPHGCTTSVSALEGSIPGSSQLLG